MDSIIILGGWQKPAESNDLYIPYSQMGSLVHSVRVWGAVSFKPLPRLWHQLNEKRIIKERKGHDMTAPKGGGGDSLLCTFGTSGKVQSGYNCLSWVMWERVRRGGPGAAARRSKVKTRF